MLDHNPKSENEKQQVQMQQLPPDQVTQQQNGEVQQSKLEKYGKQYGNSEMLVLALHGLTF